jgi:hypothetical protein
MAMAPLLKESIARITYAPNAVEQGAEGGLKYASGFFVDTEKYGKACVTCAHVVDDHPGPNKDVLYVNEIESRVLFNAGTELGIDVALLESQREVLESGVHLHQLGTTSVLNRIYYTHAWSVFQARPGALEFSKVWGPRFAYDSQRLARRGAKIYGTWRLRNDVYDPRSGRSFSSKNFAPGWSGSPVFNVRERLDDHRVIGVLSVVAQEEGEALAVSIEQLDFLRPMEPQAGEAWVGRAPEGPLQRAAARLGLMKRSGKPRYAIRYDAGEGERQLYNIRFTEITGQPVCPQVPQPPSPYDR